jgi:ATP-dependent helicase/nuclease subunit A
MQALAQRRAVPDWLTRAAIEARTKAVAPSHVSPDLVAVEFAMEAMRRGDLLHRLLQMLPSVDTQQRGDRAHRLLTTIAGDLPQATRDALAAEAVAVIGHAQCAMLFGAGSRAELPVFARIETEDGPFEVSGRIDRLIETEDAIWIADFKTDATPPAQPPPAYVRQLALYRAAVVRLYPDKPVRAHVVWTVKAQMQEIPSSRLDEALRQALADRPRLDPGPPAT